MGRSNKKQPEQAVKVEPTFDEFTTGVLFALEQFRALMQDRSNEIGVADAALRQASPLIRNNLNAYSTLLSGIETDFTVRMQKALTTRKILKETK